MEKEKYRIRNWRKYNEALVSRGQLTFWFDEEAIASWEETERTGRRGAPRVYSDVAIQCALTLRVVLSKCRVELRRAQSKAESFRPAPFRLHSGV